MRFMYWLAIAAILSLAPSPSVSKEVPPTRSIIATQGDALFIGRNLSIRKVGLLMLSVDIDASTKIFDRREDVARRVIVNVPARKQLADLAVGKEYLFLMGTCSNGAHVVYGRNFIFPVIRDEADTTNVAGLQSKSSISDLRHAFATLPGRDTSLTSHVCKMLFTQKTSYSSDAQTS